MAEQNNTSNNTNKNNWNNNRFVLVGNVANDPEEKVAKSGLPMVIFGLYTHKEGPEGERKDEVYNCIFRGKNAENLPRGVRKGTFIRVTGTLKSQYTPPTEEEKAEGKKGVSQIFLNPISCQVLSQAKGEGEVVHVTEESYEDPSQIL